MKQKKSKQPKSKKSNHSTSHKNNAARKKHGKQADLSELRLQLDQLGLKIIQVAADGNCFFRALADQLEGNEGEHIKYRDMVVHYILSNRENFEPFIEDEVPFDEYCQSMIKDGTWAGNLELQAASLVFKRNICIHRANYPRWYISNFNDHETTMIHLSYHDGEHYNSVRLQDDSCEGPAKPIVIKVDANVSAFNNKKATSNDSKPSSSKNTLYSESIKLVVLGTGCENINKVRQVLQEVNGDADSAIEYLIMERDIDMNGDKNLNVSYEDIGDDENDKNASLEDALINLACEDAFTENGTQLLKQHNDDKGTSNNKEISTDSLRKCRASSSSTTRKTTEAHVFNKSPPARRGKKEIKQSKKKEAARQASKCPPKIIQDVGALRI